MKRGIATFTLDSGRCPPWLFERMVKLARIVTSAIVDYAGPEEFLKRLSDPVWFQAFGSLLAFDWNASGLTTTTMGALKEAVRGLEQDLGIFIAGGKGKTSKKTPSQIIMWGERLNMPPERAVRFTYLSRLTAKVDSALVQDGFALYHHNFLFTRKGTWAVVQQGMSTTTSRARRYHWYSDTVRDPTIEPHNAIQSEHAVPFVLNLTSQKSVPNREGAVELVSHKKDLFYEIRRLKLGNYQLNLLDLSSNDFRTHPAENELLFLKENKEARELLSNPRLQKALGRVVEKENKSYEDILMTKKVGPKTIRALSLVSEVIFGRKPSFEDPLRYTYAFGGKDGIPYPVNKKTYDQTIEIIERALKKSRLGHQEKQKLLQRNEKLFTV